MKPESRQETISLVSIFLQANRYRKIVGEVGKYLPGNDVSPDQFISNVIEITDPGAEVEQEEIKKSRKMMNEVLSGPLKF